MRKKYKSAYCCSSVFKSISPIAIITDHIYLVNSGQLNLRKRIINLCVDSGRVGVGDNKYCLEPRSWITIIPSRGEMDSPRLPNNDLAELSALLWFQITWIRIRNKSVQLPKAYNGLCSIWSQFQIGHKFGMEVPITECVFPCAEIS